MISKGDLVELLVALIRNACVNDGTPDSGGEARSVATLEAYLGTADWTFEPHPGRTSAIWRVPGTDPGAPSLMLMGHTDVVPVSAEGWSVDPFGGERRDGFVWGRGAVDMLNQTTAMAAVFGQYRRGATPPLPGDLLFLAVADEEAGGRLGARPLVSDHWDEVACDYLLTEIGTPLLDGTNGPGLPVTVAEKGPQWRRRDSRPWQPAIRHPERPGADGRRDGPTRLGPASGRDQRRVAAVRRGVGSSGWPRRGVARHRPDR
jgi:acetylornithine deacetylase/succinyl-diaminopimelate desuccinylase-like protein